MKNLLIIGCSHSIGDMDKHKRHTEFNWQDVYSTGWARHIYDKLDKLNYNIDVIALPGYGIDEFLFIIQKLYLDNDPSIYWPDTKNGLKVTLDEKYKQISHSLAPLSSWIDVADVYNHDMPFEFKYNGKKILPEYDKIIIQLTGAGRSRRVHITDGQIKPVFIHPDRYIITDHNDRTFRRFTLEGISSRPGSSKLAINYQDYKGIVSNFFNIFVKKDYGFNIDIPDNQRDLFTSLLDLREYHCIKSDLYSLITLNYLINSLPDLKNKVFGFFWWLPSWPDNVNFISKNGEIIKGFDKDSIWPDSPTLMHEPDTNNRSHKLDWVIKSKTFIFWYVEKYGKKDYINNIIDTGHHLNNIAQEKVLDFLEPELKEFLEQ